MKSRKVFSLGSWQVICCGECVTKNRVCLWIIRVEFLSGSSFAQCIGEVVLVCKILGGVDMFQSRCWSQIEPPVINIDAPVNHCRRVVSKRIWA